MIKVLYDFLGWCAYANLFIFTDSSESEEVSQASEPEEELNEVESDGEREALARLLPSPPTIPRVPPSPPPIAPPRRRARIADIVDAPVPAPGPSQATTHNRPVRQRNVPAGLQDFVLTPIGARPRRSLNSISPNNGTPIPAEVTAAARPTAIALPNTVSIICPICKTNNRECAFQPCGHTVCWQCACQIRGRTSKCGRCQQTIQSISQLTLID